MQQPKKKWIPKKLRYIILPLATILLLAAALLLTKQRHRESAPDADRTDPYSEISILPIPDVSAYCVGEDGTLYIFQEGENAIRAYTADGTCTAVYPVEVDIILEQEDDSDTGNDPNKEDEKPADSEKNPDDPENQNSGSQLAQNWETEKENEKLTGTGLYALRGLCYADGKVYCYRGGTDSYLCLDLVSGNTEVIWKREDVQAYEIAISGEMAAILYRDGQEDDCDQSIGEGRTEIYWCDGGRLGLLNLRTLEWKPLDYHYLVTVTAMGDHGFLLEGFDRENGYYLAELDMEGVLGERRATGFWEKIYLAWDEERSMFHGAGAFGWERKCSSGTLEQPEKAYRYWKNELRPENGGVRFAADFLYVLNNSARPSEGGRITRLKPALFFRDAEPLRVCLCDPSLEPDWQGYPVEVELLRLEELVLKLLAGDSDFDLVITDSQMAAAWNMKRVKAYYPLQAALAEPLSACFDGVQQFAADGEAIWALPLSMNLQALVYSEENLKRAGADAAAMETMPGLVGVADLLDAAGWSGWYSASFNSIENGLLQDYLASRVGAGRISFDTPEFSSLLDAVGEYIGRKSLMSELTFWGSRERYQEVYDRIVGGGGTVEEADSAVEEASRQDILFDLVTWQGAEEYGKFTGREQFVIRPIPGMDAGEKEYTARIGMLVVNPASARRDQALDLVEGIAAAQISNPGNYLSADRSLYPEDAFSEALYRACSEAAVRETLPQEIYEAIFIKILNGEVSREEGVKELERVVNAYLFE